MPVMKSSIMAVSESKENPKATLKEPASIQVQGAWAKTAFGWSESAKSSVSTKAPPAATVPKKPESPRLGPSSVSAPARAKMPLRRAPAKGRTGSSQR